MGKIRVLIADDHAVVREGTRMMLEQEGDTGYFCCCAGVYAATGHFTLRTPYGCSI
jgi:DNA-binding NarL/FixJ family response regulator